MMQLIILTVFVCLWTFYGSATACLSAETAAADHPIAIRLGREPNTALIAQQRGGALILVDYEQGKVLQTLGRFGTILDLEALTSGQFLVAADAPPRLIHLSRASTTTQREISWPTRPTAVKVSASGNHLAILNRDDRRVDLLAASTIQSPPFDKSRVQTVKLPFQPGRCLWLPDERHLIVTDAYGGRLAVIDASNGLLRSLRTIPGHNIAGLTLTPQGDRLYLTQQILHSGSSTTYDDIHWGQALTNVLRSLAVSDLIDPTADHLAHDIILPLGQTGRATGDPADIIVRSDGMLIVTLAGVNELAIDRGKGQDWKRVAVGARPTAVTLTHDGQRALVVNTLDNTLSLVRLANAGAVGRTISLGAVAPTTAADRGERLFFDARLSHDSWMSCHSCHPHGHTNGQVVDNFSDGTDLTAKRVLSLRGVGGTAPYAWDGRFAKLADQVRHSVTNTMQGQPISESQVQDLVAYLESLPTPPQLRSDSDQSQIAAGKKVFDREGCTQCHAGPTYTSAATYDVGLTDERGHRRFNPPSLRGVRWADSFFHDARAHQLEDVLRIQQHQLSAPLGEDDLQALLAFLRSL